MPSLCSIDWCRNSSTRTRIPSARYFKLPRNDHFGNKWLKWIARENAPACKTRKHVLLCCEHFHKSSVLANGKLAPGTVPSIGKRISHALDEPTDEPVTLSSLLESSEPVVCCAVVPSLVQTFRDLSNSSVLSYSDLSSKHNNKENPQGVSMPLQEISSVPNNSGLASCDHEILATDQTIPEEYSITSSIDISTKHEIKEIHSVPNNSDLSSCDHEISATGQILACSIDSTPKCNSTGDNSEDDCTQMKNISSASNNCAPASTPVTPKSTPRKFTRKYKRFLVQLSPSDFSNPRTAATHLNMAKESHIMLKKKMLAERSRRYRLEKKVKSLLSLVEHLKTDKNG